MNKPIVYNYKDATQFLIALFEYEQSIDHDLSVRKWSKFLDIDSQNLILIFQKKKKISLQIASKIALALKMDSEEEAYLEMMAKINQASSEKDKKIFEIALAELRKHTGSTTMVEDQSVFSHWIHMAILSMSKVEGFYCNRDTIKDFLSDDVSQEIIDEAIERLIQSDLVSMDAEGNLKKRFDNTTSRNDAFKKSPHMYFEQVAELAKRGSKVEAEEREFQCFSLAIKHEHIPQFKEMIRNFRAKVCTFAENETSDQVYQFNIQFFPLTKKHQGYGIPLEAQFESNRA